MPANKVTPLLAISLIAATALLAPVASAQAPRESPKGSVAQSDTRYVKAGAVNVRGGPGTRHTVKAVLNLGAEVSIYLVQGDWARISGPDKPEQWVYAPLLQHSNPAAPSRKPTAKPAPASKAAQPVSPTLTPDSHNKEPDDHTDRSRPAPH
jgi:SH3-like domain-containing protein